MRRGNPVDLEEQGRNRQRDIRKHKERKREQVSHDPPFRRAMDMLELGDGCEQTHGEKRDVHKAKRKQKRTYAHFNLGICRQEPMRHHADDDKGAVCKQGDQRQEHAGSDGHKQVIGSEATKLGNSFD